MREERQVGFFFLFLWWWEYILLSYLRGWGINRRELEVDMKWGFCQINPYSGRCLSGLKEVAQGMRENITNYLNVLIVWGKIVFVISIKPKESTDEETHTCNTKWVWQQAFQFALFWTKWDSLEPTKGLEQWMLLINSVWLELWWLGELSHCWLFRGTVFFFFLARTVFWRTMYLLMVFRLRLRTLVLDRVFLILNCRCFGQM